ncbi:CpsD/CapB family tyrosine-protein kinase [Streptomyces sp. CB01881]|uniref:CpsD/CapB family tyrosine-protein kinase n=1 Tax=Streptomyces sp. CB01881 TaxID=2078691 RepID=UPI0013A56F71|nr:CpsD/CapB family tyrosine-protein kinase [Streptomyces sp. CB01881]
MAELLSGEQLGELDELIRPTNAEGVSLITGGNTTAYPAALVLRAAEALRRARRYADVILVDTSPLLHANDAYDLVQHADAVLVTVRSGNVTPEQADRVSELLSRTGVPVAGVALLGTYGPTGRRRRSAAGGGTAALGGRSAQTALPRPGAPAPEHGGQRAAERGSGRPAGRSAERTAPSWARRGATGTGTGGHGANDTNGSNGSNGHGTQASGGDGDHGEPALLREGEER